MKNTTFKTGRAAVLASSVYFMACAPMTESARAQTPASEKPASHHSKTGSNVIQMGEVEVKGTSEQTQANEQAVDPLALNSAMKEIATGLSGEPRVKAEGLFAMLHKGGPRGVNVIDMRGKLPKTGAEALASGGDCTDLANLAISILREAGVPGGAIVVHFKSAPAGIEHMVAYVELDGKRVVFDLQAQKMGETAQGKYTVVLEMTYDQSRSIYHREMGDYYRENNQPDEAIRAYGRALELFDRDPYIHQNLGVLYEKSGNMEASTMHFRKAAEIDPSYKKDQKRGDFNTELQAGKRAVDEGRWEDCVSHFQNALDSGEKMGKKERGAIQEVLDECRSRKSQ